MAKPKTELAYRLNIIKRMKEVGTYREEFSTTIDRLATLYCQRDKLEEQYEATGGNPVVMHTNRAGLTNPAKNPFLTARDEVYKQLLAHERELGLTPRSLKQLNEPALKKADKNVSFISALVESLETAGV